MCCRKLCTAALLWDHFTSRGPAKDRSMVRSPSLAQEELGGFTPQESVKFRDLKLSCMPKIKKRGQRRGEHRAQMETREARVIDCFSVRDH